MIFVLGSINLDMIATGQRLPKPGETVSATQFTSSAGGKGANQALAAARAGASVKMIGAVGSDNFVKKALKDLRAANIDLTCVRAVPGPTGIAIILVDERGENVIVIVAGANGEVSEKDALTAVKKMSKDDILVMVQEVPAKTLRAALLAAKTKGIMTLLNIAPVSPQTRDLAVLADVVIANETEFYALSDHDPDKLDMEQVAAGWARENNKILIITLGKKGAIGFTPTTQFKVNALDIVPIDTVGAGDTFCGYLAAGLAQGYSLEKALQSATIAGSLACLSPGAQPAIPFANDVLGALNS
ncbi:MAG: ribokinase [Devosiaceae bacterium]|nr:ribokinase [Devosiaceae bacterium]